MTGETSLIVNQPLIGSDIVKDTSYQGRRYYHYHQGKYRVKVIRPPLSLYSSLQPNLFFDRIFIINLDRSPDRWYRMQMDLTKMGIFNYERQRGIALPRKNPYTSLPHSLFTNLEAYGGRFSGDHNYILNCVGTNLAHFEIVKKCIKRGYQRVLVLEDDVFLGKDFNSKFLRGAQSLYQLGDDWHLAYLGFKKSRPQFNPKSLTKELSIPRSCIRGAYGYAMNKPIFELLAKNFLYRGMEIDAFFEFFLCKFSKVVCFNPPIIHHRDGAESTITGAKWKKRNF